MVDDMVGFEWELCSSFCMTQHQQISLEKEMLCGLKMTREEFMDFDIQKQNLHFHVCILFWFK